MILVETRPGNVMNRAGARDRRLTIARLETIDRRARLVPCTPGVALALKAQRLQHRRAAEGIARLRGDTNHAPQRVLIRHVRRMGVREALASVDHHEARNETFVVPDSETLGRTLRRGFSDQVSFPPVERSNRRDAPIDPRHHPFARAPQPRAWVLKKRQCSTRSSRVIAVVQVICTGIIEVDGLLDESQAQHTAIELGVTRTVSGDCGDVMNALQLHQTTRRCLEKPTDCCTGARQAPPRR